MYIKIGTREASNIIYNIKTNNNSKPKHVKANSDTCKQQTVKHETRKTVKKKNMKNSNSNNHQFMGTEMKVEPASKELH